MEVSGNNLDYIMLLLTFDSSYAGVLSCAINAVTLALLDAGIACSDYVVSLSIGLHLSRSTTLLDLTLQEENSLPNLVIASLPRSGKITLAQMETRIHASALEDMFSIALQGCSVLQEEFDMAMRQRTRKLADALGRKGHSDGQSNMETD
jgi:exosome complex component RRP41